jgi:hypothetical protein
VVRRSILNILSDADSPLVLSIVFFGSAHSSKSPRKPRQHTTHARRLFDGKPKDGNVEEMAVDPIDREPMDGGSCQSTGSGGYKAWVLA